MNCPFRTGSLTAERNSRSDEVTGRGPRLSRLEDGLRLRHCLETGRERIAGQLRRGSIGELVASRRGEAKSQAVGRRTTAGIVKVTQRRLLAELGFREPSPRSMGEGCHSRASKWAQAPGDPGGVKGGGMGRQFLRANGEAPSRHGGATGSRRVFRIRRKAEIGGVGRAGESEMAIVVRKAADNRTLPSEGPLA